ncbi:hypothetical protein ES702_00473 [subsurface metagenome]
MSWRRLRWYLGGSFNIFKVLHCYIVDYLRYPQHFRVKIEETERRKRK